MSETRLIKLYQNRNRVFLVEVFRQVHEEVGEEFRIHRSRQEFEESIP